MSENAPEQRIDPFLLPFLRTTDEQEARYHLDELLARAAPGIATITRSSRTPEDAFQETTYRVVKHLRQLRTYPNGNAIGNYLHYVQVVASRVVKGQVRTEHPNHRSLVDALRHALKREPALAAWENEGEKLCGLAPWREEQPGRIRSERLTRLLDDPRAFAEILSPECDPARANHVDLLRRLFEWLGHPTRFDELTKIVCGLKQIQDLSLVAGGEVTGRGLSEWLPDNRRQPDEEAEWREFLGRLWAEIERLPRPHRLAYLLNFTAGDGQLEIFWLYGTVSIRQIGAVLQVTEDEFTRIWPVLELNHEIYPTYDHRFAVLWQHLPLADAVIAVLLGTDRQKIINLRRAAGDRLSRLMVRSESTNLTSCNMPRPASSSRIERAEQAAVRKKRSIGIPPFIRSARRLSATNLGPGATAGS